MATFRLVYKLAGLAFIQLLAGLMGWIVVIALYPFPNARMAMITRVMRLWGQMSCLLLNIRIEREGCPIRANQGALIVANHIGAVDILVVAACFKIFFVSNSDIASWPIIGPLNRLGGTIFIDRSQRTKVLGMVQELADRLRSGFSVLVFPEGGITTGHQIGSFKSSAFEAVVQAKCSVVPILIRYYDAGEPSVLSWPDDMTFLEHMTNILRHPRLDVHVCVLPAVEGEPDRRAFAEKSWKLISDKFEETRNAAVE